jgi:hypothetical protein
MATPDRYKCRAFYESLQDRFAVRDDLAPPAGKPDGA